MASTDWKTSSNRRWSPRSMHVVIWTIVILVRSATVLAQEYAFNNRVLEKSATCDRNFIYFTINFARPFLGLIYTDGAFGSQRCTYVNGSAFSQIRYNITIPLNECRSQTFPNGSSQNVVVVQRDWRILEASDNLFVITCSNSPLGPGGSAPGFNAAGGKFTLSFAGVTVQGTLASTELVTSSFSDIDYTAEVLLGSGTNGRRLDRALGVGEQISYVVRLKKLRPGQFDARIGRCWATDGLPSSSSGSGSSSTEIQLSDDDGCTVLPGSNIWNNFRAAPSEEVGGDGKILYNEIKAWAFPTSSRVNIFCNLHLCPGTCPPPPCRLRDESFTTTPSANGTGKPKAKRTADLAATNSPLEAEEDEEHMVTRISSSYEVFPDRRRARDQPPSIDRYDSLLVTAGLRDPREPEYDSRSGGEGEETTTATLRTVCLTHTNFVIGVSLLLLIIVLSFVFIIGLLCKMARRRGDRAKRIFQSERIRRLFGSGSSRDGFPIERRRSAAVGSTTAAAASSSVYGCDGGGDSESAMTNSTLGRTVR